MIGKQCQAKLPETFSYDPTCFTKPPAHLVNKEHYVGYLIDIVEAVAANLNFTYRVQPPKDKNQFIFGVGSSGNESGLVGMVSKGEAEIVLASLSISKERSRAIDFSTHIDYYVRNLWTTYVMSFHTSTWVGTAALVLVATWTLWVIHRAERHTPEDLRSFRDLLFLFFSCLVQQGVPSTPHTYRGRAVFCVFWFACVILYASYTAGLTSALTVSTEGPPFTSLMGAVDVYPSWEIGISKGTAIEEFVKDAQGTEYRTLMKLLSADPGLYVSSEDEGIHRMLTSNYVFFTDSPIMRFMLRDNCSIREIHVNLFKSYGHLGYMKNLPFAWVIDAELSLMSDSGVLDRLNKKWWGRGTPCEDPSHFTELGFVQTATAFLILLVGLGLASFFLITEKIIGRRFKSRINRETKSLYIRGGTRTAAERARKHFLVIPDPKYANDYGGLVPTGS
ncbi:glutamate receptor ionotropic, kainate glr-3 isoform X2 [Penaeus vannamei]|uniref:glutamate receptor ionotropic, kainate glr-3 isoform X2 n=1 Tax=Penaeus vannamei TaxID=6689 RepID=UPI00387F7F59